MFLEFIRLSDFRISPILPIAALEATTQQPPALLQVYHITHTSVSPSVYTCWGLVTYGLYRGQLPRCLRLCLRRVKWHRSLDMRLGPERRLHTYILPLSSLEWRRQIGEEEALLIQLVIP